MTLEMGFLFLILAGMVLLFLTEKIPVDLTACLGLLILIFTGFVPANEAFMGFASSAVITMLSIFVVGASLLHTGVADMIGERIHAWVGGCEVSLIVVTMLVAGVLSAFINNVAAVAVLMPTVASLARYTGLAPSRLFIPLAFGAILGGTTTLVGTPPNILVGSMLESQGMEPFDLFDFTPVGISILVLGVIFMATIGRKLLPSHRIGSVPSVTEALADIYRLDERIFSIVIPKGSSLEHTTLEKARLSTAIGVQVVAILRNGGKELVPHPKTVLNCGDTLLVEGRLSHLKHILKVRGTEIQEVRIGQLPSPGSRFTAVRVQVDKKSSILSKSLQQLDFRGKYGAIVLTISRDSKQLNDRLGEEILKAGDELVIIGTKEALDKLGSHPDLTIIETGLATIRKLQKHLFMIKVRSESPLVGITLGGSRIGELIGLTVGGIVRKGEIRLAVSPNEVIQPGDNLLVAGESNRIASLLELGDIQFDSEVDASGLGSEDVVLVEVSLSPRCSLIGNALKDILFRQRYGLQVLAVWREGSPIRTKLAKLKLTFGDALLLQGPAEKIRMLATDPDFLLLSQAVQSIRRVRKAPFSVACLMLMIGLVTFNIQPIHVAAFTAASLVLLSGAVSMKEAYRSIEWKAIVLVAAILPVGIAMENTGAALWLADTVVSMAGPLGPQMVLAILVVFSSLLSQGLDGAPTVVLLTPVVLRISLGLGLSPYPMMMGVGLAASAAFMTPFSHKANLLVMGAGGYRSLDYLRVGTPLTVIVLVLIVFLVPLLFPF